jgi:hypothetical protein
MIIAKHQVEVIKCGRRTDNGKETASSKWLGARFDVNETKDRRDYTLVVRGENGRSERIAKVNCKIIKTYDDKTEQVTLPLEVAKREAPISNSKDVTEKLLKRIAETIELYRESEQELFEYTPIKQYGAGVDVCELHDLCIENGQLFVLVAGSTKIYCGSLPYSIANIPKVGLVLIDPVKNLLDNHNLISLIKIYSLK